MIEDKHIMYMVIKVLHQNIEVSHIWQDKAECTLAA